MAKRTRLQTKKFYREISGGKTSKKSEAVVERGGSYDDIVFLEILGSGGGDKCLTNAGEVGTPEGSGWGGEAAGVEGSSSVQREIDCVDEVEKELDIIDVEKELTCLEVEVGEKVGKKKKKNGGDEALKNCSAGKRITGFQERINGQVSARNENAENGKEASGSVKLDGSSEEESLSSSSSEENDDLEDEDYAAERSSSDFVKPEDGEAAIDEVSSEDGDSFGVKDLREMAKGSHPSSEMKKNTKNKEENKSWGVVTAPSSMWIDEEEDEEETASLVWQNSVAQRTRFHDIAPRQGIVEEKASLGTFDNPYCLVEDGAENVVTSKKTNSAHERTRPSGTAGSKTPASKSMSVDYENVNDALEVSSDVEGGKAEENEKPAHAKQGKTSSDAKKVLLGSIWGEEDLLDMTRELNPEVEPSSPKVKKITDWLFKWGDDSPSPPEKTPEELQMEELWMELDFCLRTSEMVPENGEVVSLASNNGSPILLGSRRITNSYAILSYIQAWLDVNIFSVSVDSQDSILMYAFSVAFSRKQLCDSYCSSVLFRSKMKIRIMSLICVARGTMMGY